MAFGFDPRAALARARNQPRSHPTPPTLPTVASGETETVGTVGTVGRPRAAPVAGTCAAAAPAADLDAFEERGAIASHDGGETREGAERAAGLADALAEAERPRDGTGWEDWPNSDHAPDRPSAADLAALEGLVSAHAPDPARLARLIAERGPTTCGAAAIALGWGATRAWRAEAALRERGLVEHDKLGRAALTALWRDFEAQNDPLDPRAWA